VLSVVISTLSWKIAIGIVKISQYVCGISQLPVSFDAVPDRQGCGIVKISQYVCGISQLPVSFDAVPDRQGCPCAPTEVGVDSASIQLGSPENVEITA